MARVLVNRFWMHHFGLGIVPMPGDFGTQGERPSHPELLDWLARTFMDDGWSLKRFHKRIMTSTAYRQASRRHPGGEAVDADNILYWRMPVRRLEAEAVRDAVRAVSGALNPRPFGPAVPVGIDPDGQIVAAIDPAAEMQAGNVKPQAGSQKESTEAFRRSVYVQVRRTRPLGVLEAFDAPTLDPNCEARPISTAPPQALFFLNNKFAEEQADRFARCVVRESGDDTRAQVRRAFSLAMAREPAPQELERCLNFLRVQADHYQRGGPAGKDSAGLALANLCRALFAASEFIYVD